MGASLPDSFPNNEIKDTCLHYQQAKLFCEGLSHRVKENFADAIKPRKNESSISIIKNRLGMRSKKIVIIEEENLESSNEVTKEGNHLALFEKELTKRLMCINRDGADFSDNRQIKLSQILLEEFSGGMDHDKMINLIENISSGLGSEANEEELEVKFSEDNNPNNEVLLRDHENLKQSNSLMRKDDFTVLGG